MRYAPRILVCLLSMLLAVTVALAQKSTREVEADDAAALGKLKDAGGREKHQGADHPNQGNSSPDPYGAENFKLFSEKNERRLNDPQWQLKLDLYDPKRIVIEYPDGSSEEYWYVLFRVINDNIRRNYTTTEPNINPDGARDPKPVDTTKNENEYEGVPVDTTIDMDVVTYTRNIDRSPWDESANGIAPEKLRNIKKTYRPVSDPYVLQQIAIKEELYEWVQNSAGMHERVVLVHPMSDFQRQAGLVHKLEAPDFSGPRCLPIRVVRNEGAVRAEFERFVGVYDDNSFAGYFGNDEQAPEGVRVVKEATDPMWGNLTKRRYAANDCVDRFGRILQTNDPGYLNARVSGGEEGSARYGVLKADNPLVGKPAQIPHVRQYRAASGDKPADKVLFGFDTKVPVPGHVEDFYIINGKVINAASTYRTATENVSLWGVAGSVDVTDDLTQFGGKVAGKPVKMVDHLGRAIKRYMVTYQVGDVVTKAEWDIWSKRLGKGLLARFGNPTNIADRPLTANDPLVGLPKIKMGKAIGNADDLAAEIITRGVESGDRDKITGAPLLKKVENFTTGRGYDPKKITPDHFMRDPDGTFTTHRKAPLPEGHGLNAGEEYIYAPLGSAEADAIAIPFFDRLDKFGAWEDYRDPISGSRVPLTDEQGEIVRDEFDQILYLKEYEYEYVYMYEYEPVDETDAGFKGEYGMDRDRLKKSVVEKMKFLGDVPIGPLRQVIVEKRDVTGPKAIKYHGRVLEDGTQEWINETAFAAKSEDDRKAYTLKDIRIEIVTEQEEQEIGIYVEGDKRYDSTKHTLRDEKLPVGVSVRASNPSNETEKILTYLEKVRDEIVAGGDPRNATPMKEEDFTREMVKEGENEVEKSAPDNNSLNPIKQVYRRWTVPPPLVYKNNSPKPGEGDWTVLTRLSEAYGPARRMDGADAPRFLTRYISEMWGVFVFKNVDRDWDYMNVVVRGLRGYVGHAGLKPDTQTTSLPSHKDTVVEPGKQPDPVNKAFFNTRLNAENWLYRVRFERLGDGLEAYRDLIRRQQTYWYIEDPAAPGTYKMGDGKDVDG
ncbi:MAG: hypothetical protein IT462_10625 [Planctomycetes bacterium]|nr:hypothetical protein [Planctomycetota bacterium]